jgi:hypothetical protein
MAQQEPTAELVAILRIALHSMEASAWNNSPRIEGLKPALRNAIREIESEGKTHLRPRLIFSRERAGATDVQALSLL